MGATIVADNGTHLIVRQADRFALIERRSGRYYNCHDDKRDGIPLDTISDIGSILDAGDWTDEATARSALDEVLARGAQLNESMR